MIIDSKVFFVTKFTLTIRVDEKKEDRFQKLSHYIDFKRKQ